MDRFTQYAIVAARRLLKDAQLDINENTADRIGVWIGSVIVVWKHLKLHINN